jgi:hypothetical protein
MTALTRSVIPEAARILIIPENCYLIAKHSMG